MKRIFTNWLEEVCADHVGLVGGKCAGLGELIRAGIRVPLGFAVNTRAYVSFIESSGLKDKISRSLSDINLDDTALIEEISADIRSSVMEAEIPKEIYKEIEESYSLLCEKCNLDKVPVAVRSSATAEDLPTASFAGLQDTYLWIRGAEEVVRAVRQCWASLFTARAVVYRIENGFPHEKVLASVGIQKMVNARTAGVLFTLNPVNGDRSKISIEANWGLGESVVSGSASPDQYLVDKVTLEIAARRIARKTIECIPDVCTGEIKHVEVPPERQGIPCLTDEEVQELAKLGKRIEQHYGCPQDTEWAIDRELPFPQNVVFLQSRPETVWSKRKREPIFTGKTPLQYILEVIKQGEAVKAVASS